jgi:hypothetical protein
MEEQQNSAALYWCAALALAESPRSLLDYDFFFRDGAVRGFAVVLVLALALALGCACGAGAGAAGMSPITPLSGQILKTGHFLQPTAMAIGQRVMGIPVNGDFNF